MECCPPHADVLPVGPVERALAALCPYRPQVHTAGGGGCGPVGVHTVAVEGPRWSRRRRTLSARLLVGHVGVLLLAGLIGFFLWARAARSELDDQYEQRALAIAQAVASTPQVEAALVAGDPAGVQELAQRTARATGASYVVVIDRNGVRYSHPNAALIGRVIEEPVVALDGAPHVGVDLGSLGRSANGRAPVLAPDGTVVGEVSTGVVETAIAAKAGDELVNLAVYLAVALAVGLAAAVLLARQLKQQTFGLELDEIAGLLQEREATLHGIREGVVAVDPSGRLSLMNDQAHQLLGTSPADRGRAVEDVLPDGDLRDLLRDPGDAADRLVLLDGRLLVGSRVRVSHGGRDLGSVVTLRDRTELEAALRELDEVRSLTDALRAQQHEFSNRMHVMSGLLEMRRYDDAIGYAVEIETATSGVASTLEAHIDSPRIVALLLAKSTVARERGVELTVTAAVRVAVEDAAVDALVSILGNLIDNAIEAAGSGGGAGEIPSVTVVLADDERELVVEVADSGPGIPAGAAASIFTGGWSTKLVPGGRARGIGLALVRQLVGQLGGSIEVEERPGARFRVVVPTPRGPSPTADAVLRGAGP
ncbi:MAG: two-component system, CitB family, sensor kinase [Pseudonocardiales bacterium]|nr:two-component system, CitB family, sensor kinase [Pseudonocardiales bacterium]